MKPDSEHHADRVAFVNICEAFAERLHELEAGGLTFDLQVFGPDGLVEELWTNRRSAEDIPQGALEEVPPGEHPDDFPNKAEQEAAGLDIPVELEPVVLDPPPETTMKSSKRKGK